LIQCPDWQASLEAALTAIGVDTNTSVVTNNGDGTYTHNDGTGVTVLIDTRANSNPYDNATSGLTATTVQAAVDELADCCPTYSVAAVAGTDALGNAYNVGDAIATLPNGTIYLIEGSISHNADTTSADLATAIAALPAAAGEGDTASWVRPDGNETASFHYTDGAWRLMGGSAATADNLRAWGTGNAQQSNADDVAVGDAIYHTGTVTIGAVDSTHDANTALTVQGASSFGSSNHTVSGANSFTSGNNNTNSALNGFVGGGTGNEASGANAAVVGGQNNTASGVYSGVVGSLNSTASGTRSVAAAANGATVGGGNAFATGLRPTANGNSSFVAGGTDNQANANGTFAAAGQDNIAGGVYSVAIGENNNVTGASSRAFGSRNVISSASAYALGTGASITHNNSILISTDDNTGANPLASAVTKEFAVRATGGVRIFTDNTFADATGVTMAANASAWVAVSSKDTKTAFQPVDKATILDRIKSLDVFSYKTQSAPDGDRHLGVDAIEINAKFADVFTPKKVGNLDGISNLDMQGLLFAAVQRLAEEIDNLKGQLALSAA
jgi:hypothetical protein